MNWSLVFSPLVPWPVVVGIVIVAILVVIPGLIRRMRGGWLRAMERDGVFEALLSYQREAVASGEPQKVMAAFLAERGRRRAASAGAS